MLSRPKTVGGSITNAIRMKLKLGGLAGRMFFDTLGTPAPEGIPFLPGEATWNSASFRASASRTTIH